MTDAHHSDTRDLLIGNLLDRWEMTPNDLKQEMREHGCGKQLDALLRDVENPPPQSGEQYLSALVDVPAVESEPVALIEREVLTELQKHWNATGTVSSPHFEQSRYKIFDKVPLYASPVRSAIVPAPAEETWQPIETAPKDGTTVLVAFWLWNDRKNGYGYQVAEWCGDADGEWQTQEDVTLYPPTHWRPLPAPPSLVHAEDGMAHGSATTTKGSDHG